jgi:sugar fermentation stimulation protein A
MDFPTQLVEGRFVRRYKRFFVDVQLPDGEIVVAHCANTGTMKSCLEDRSPVWISPSTNPKRKLKWTWEVSVVSGVPILVNTALPNRIVREAIEAQRIPSCVGYGKLKPEVKYGSQNSRIDFLLSEGERPDCYVEVKNATLSLGDGIGAFPDAITTRGLKHLEELAEMVAQGHRGLLLFLVPRADTRQVVPADAIDPIYSQTLRRVVAAGVEVEAWKAQVTRTGVTITEPVPVVL